MSDSVPGHLVGVAVAAGPGAQLSKLDETDPLSKSTVTSDTLGNGLGDHDEGFSVRLRILAAFSMTLGILAATIGFAGPVSAAPASWTMPEVRGEVLQRAVKTVQEVTGVPGLKFRYIDRRNGQDVHNKSNWVVCYQAPVVGKKISQKSKTVTLWVKRFKQKSCWS